MVFSIIATFALMVFQNYVIKQTDSTAIKADALHYKTDLLVNGGVILALVLSLNGWTLSDPLIAIAIALFILHSAWGIVRESIDLLLDRELRDNERETISALILQHPQALGSPDLRTQVAGTTVFSQLHIEIDAI